MSKGNTTENDVVKFFAHGTSMPSYGAVLYVHAHTADPGEAGTSSTSEATYTSYARVAVDRDNTKWGICDADGTLNASGSAFKNLVQITFPECTGALDDEQLTHASLCTSGGQILYKAAISDPGTGINVQINSTPFIPAGAAIFKEN